MCVLRQSCTVSRRAPSVRHQYWHFSLLLPPLPQLEYRGVVDVETRPGVWTRTPLSSNRALNRLYQRVCFSALVWALFGGPYSPLQGLFSLQEKSGCLLLTGFPAAAEASAAKCPRWQAGRTARCRRSTGWWWSEAVVSGNQP